METTPLSQVSREIYEEIAEKAAEKTIRIFREQRKLSRNDVGRASSAVGEILKRYRAICGLSQNSLAEQAGLHETTIGKIELAKRGMSLVTFAKLAAVFLDLDYSDFATEVIYEVSQWEA